MIAHRLFFLRGTCWSVQLWICTNILELYDFNMASVFDLSCSTGWSNFKISSENYTNTAESISNEPGVLIPHAHCLGSAIIAFSVVQTRRAASTNTPKIWYLHSQKHRIITEKNNESSTEMTINYKHVCAYTILNHIQYRYTTQTSHERHGIPNTGNLTFFNSMTWLYNSKGNICTLSYSRRNQLWYITPVLMEPPLRSFVKSMTTKDGLKSLPGRLFVQECLSAYTYPDIMEIICSLFLNYFAALRIPLTLPAICGIISLAI